MRTNKIIRIEHELGVLEFKPAFQFTGIAMVKKIFKKILDRLKEREESKLIPASVLHDELREKYGEYYNTPGYNLGVYRFRSEYTQEELANLLGLKQHHISEMEHNKRPIGKAMAKRIADVLKCDYKEFL